MGGQTPAQRPAGRCATLQIEHEINTSLAPPEFQRMRSIDAYVIGKKVGEGTYGAVFLATERSTGEKVALKKIKLDHNSEKEGFPITSLREIRHLFKIEHKNVVQLKEVVYGGTTLSEQCELFMVLEYLEHDLLGIQQTVRKRGKGSNACFSIADVKCYVHQLLEGLNACHSVDVLHRDLKSANLLVSKTGYLKIADFGLSRQASDEKLTPRVCTLWYRPPELLMAGRYDVKGDERQMRLEYGKEVDIWSAGCIFAELLAGRPLFDKNEEIEALHQICSVCGSPNPETWPEVVSLPGFIACRKEFKENRLRKTLLASINRSRPVQKQTEQDKEAIADAVTLICRMLELNPAHRPTAKEIALDVYFYSKPPYCTDKDKLAGVNLPDSHALDFEHPKENPKQQNKQQGGRDQRRGGKPPMRGGPGDGDGAQPRRSPRNGPGVNGGYGGRDRYEPYPQRGRDGGQYRGGPKGRGGGGWYAGDHSGDYGGDYGGGSHRHARGDDDGAGWGAPGAYQDSWDAPGSRPYAQGGYSYGGGGGYDAPYHGARNGGDHRYMDYDDAGRGAAAMHNYYDYYDDEPPAAPQQAAPKSAASNARSKGRQ